MLAITTSAASRQRQVAYSFFNVVQLRTVLGVTPALIVAGLAGTVLTTPVRAQEFDFTGHAPVRANAPGLECRQTDHPIFAYGSPSPSARPVSRIATLMAVSGPAVGGWVPVELNGGRKGWVLAADTVRNSRVKSCFVARARDGHLIYSVYNLIS